MSAIMDQGICFTGKGSLDGKLVTRDRLEALVRALGGTHYPTFSGAIDVLVASRSDTSKAVNANAMGKKVVSYDSFFKTIGVRSHTDIDAIIAGRVTTGAINDTPSIPAISQQSIDDLVDEFGMF